MKVVTQEEGRRAPGHYWVCNPNDHEWLVAEWTGDAWELGGDSWGGDDDDYFAAIDERPVVRPMPEGHAYGASVLPPCECTWQTHSAWGSTCAPCKALAVLGITRAEIDVERAAKEEAREAAVIYRDLHAEAAGLHIKTELPWESK